MKRNLKSPRAVVLASLLALVFAACGGDSGATTTAGDSATTTEAQMDTTTSSSNETTTTAAQSSVELIAFASPEEATDYGWNQQGLEGAQAAANAVGAQLEIAAGIGYTDVAPVLRQLASLEPDLLIAHASGYRNVAPEVAIETGIPKLFFNNAEATLEGVAADIDNKTHEGGYLAGVLAARMSETGTLGIAQSADVSSWNRQAGGFVQGARSVNPDITIRIAVIGEGGFADVAGGKRITEQLIGGGADVIFGMGDGSSFGMIQAVETSAPPAGADQLWFIDVIGDKSELDEQGIYLSSVLWDFTPVFLEAIQDLDAGVFGTHGYEVSLASGALQLLQTDKIPADIWAQLEEVKADLVAGSISVDDLTTFDEVEALIGG